MTGNKMQNLIEDVRGLAVTAWQSNSSDATGIMADAKRALLRSIRRSEIPVDFEDVEIVQNRGPVVSFTGKLLCETTFSTKSGMPLDLTLEIYETQGGALVAVSSSVLTGGRGDEDCRAVIVPAQADQLAMRCAVMDFFAWDSHARSMVRKALGWSLRVEVE